MKCTKRLYYVSSEQNDKYMYKAGVKHMKKKKGKKKKAELS